MIVYCDNFKDLICAIRFLPRDAMHKRGICRHAVSVCLSVHPSVANARLRKESLKIHISVNFYCLMDMHKYGMCRHAVSVRPFVSCAKTNRYLQIVLTMW